MKSKTFLGFFIMFFIICNGVFAQSHNNEQRLTGTWVVENDDHSSSRLTGTGSTFTLNQNGTFSVGNSSGKWAISGNTIAFWGDGDFAGTYSFFMTPDGRSLYIPRLATFQKR